MTMFRLSGLVPARRRLKEQSIRPEMGNERIQKHRRVLVPLKKEPWHNNKTVIMVVNQAEQQTTNVMSSLIGTWVNATLLFLA